MSPAGMPPNPSKHRKVDEAEVLDMVATAIFAQRVGCTADEVEALIETNSLLQLEFDAIMDSVAVDGLRDDCNLGVVDETFIHLSDAGLVNPRRVQIGSGVYIPTHRPYHRERALHKV